MSNEIKNQTAAVLANTLVNVGPAYVVLAEAISTELRAYGIEPKAQAKTVDGIPGNANWACWEHPTTGHKIYLSRAKSGTGVIHTTLEVNPRTPGYIDPAGKAPGRIKSFFRARQDEVLAYLIPLFVETGMPADKEPQVVTADDVKVIHAEELQSQTA